MSQEKKYQVFISSTYNDLVEAREKATKVILDLYHLPVGMEMFSADDDDQWKIITDAIDVSDYYVLILGHRYGSLTNSGISFTEKEFNYAKSKNIPILSFIRNRDAPVSNSDRESDSKSLPKLEKFIAKASKGKMCAFWTDVSDLERQLAIALPKSFARHQGIGWVRGDSKSEHVAEEIAKLSEENRKLREENEKLKSASENRKPELKVYLNDIASDMPQHETGFVIHLPILPDVRKFTLPTKRNRNALTHRFDTVSSSFSSIFGEKQPHEFFDEYNAEIDAVTELQIDNHNQSLQLLEQLNNGLLQVVITLQNIGTTLAKNVSVEIKVPDFLLVIDDEDRLDIEFYEEEFSKNLIIIESPEIRSKRTMSHDLYPPLSNLLETNMDNISLVKNSSTKVDTDNIIHINMNSLLHSKYENFKNFYLFPIEPGTGFLEVKYICGEYSYPKTFEIPITVK